MLFIQKFCAVAIVPLAMVCGLIVDAHPYAAIVLLLCAWVCAWVAVQEPPPPRVDWKRKGPNNG
jgi:hypothetical protein